MTASTGIWTARRDGVAAMGTGVWRVLGWPARVYRARQLLHELAAMAEHELRDIGLVPQDIQSASALPLDADPSIALQRRAEERRWRR